MARKYNYSRSLPRDGAFETFQVEGCDSFDEARKIVDKAIYDRRLEVPEKPIQNNRMNVPFTANEGLGVRGTGTMAIDPYPPSNTAGTTPQSTGTGVNHQ